MSFSFGWGGGGGVWKLCRYRLWKEGGRGQRYYRCKEGRGEIRLCIKQTKLSTLQVSFHQCNFCQQNNRKRKGKVYELLVKHQDIRRSNKNTRCRSKRDGAGVQEENVLKKNQGGKTVTQAVLHKAVVTTPKMAL